MRQETITAPTIKNSTDLNLVSPNELSKLSQDVVDSIARRAYEHFESRGRSSGNDWADWFLAESELLKPVKLHVVESSDHLIAHAEVPGFGSHEIKVSIEPRCLRICAKKETREDRNAGEAIMHSLGHSLRRTEQIFHVVELTAEVDPSKANATFKDGTLKVVMPKAASAGSVRAQTRAA